MIAVNKRSRSFGKGLLIYAFILALIILLGLAVFYKYIQCYENARPTHALTSYFDDLGSDGFRSDVSEFLASLDPSLRSEEDSFELLHAVASGSSVLKDVTNSTDDELIYKLKAGKDVLGSIHLVPGDKDVFGFRGWQVDSAEYDFEVLVKDDVFTVPENCKVFCGDTVLSDSYITARSVPYELFDNFYDDYDFLPVQTEYTSGRYIGELDFTVKDPDGNIVTSGIDTVLSSLACSDADTQRIKDFLYDYQSAYIYFLSGKDREFAYIKLTQARAFTVPDSPLFSRMTQAYEGGIGFASSVKDSLVSMDIHNTVDFGNGYYLCDYTYYVETYGQHSAVTVTTNNSRIMLVDNGSGLLACSQMSY